MKKEDLMLAVILLLFTCVVPFLLLRIFPAEGGGDTVLIYRNGEIYGRYSLFESRELDIQSTSGYNKVLIDDGKVSVIEADCAGNDCVRCSAIDSPGEFIICVPHGLYIVIAASGLDYVPDGVTY